MKPGPREIEGEKFAMASMTAFFEGWDTFLEGRSMFYSPVGYSGARLAAWRSGWRAAKLESEPKGGAAEPGADERVA